MIEHKLNIIYLICYISISIFIINVVEIEKKNPALKFGFISNKYYIPIGYNIILIYLTAKEKYI